VAAGVNDLTEAKIDDVVGAVWVRVTLDVPDKAHRDRNRWAKWPSPHSNISTGGFLLLH
jgi:hypothetical protein